MTENNVPICIYCKRTDRSFTNEHVLTRAFCGTGENWTLQNSVCGKCNGTFSKYEAHWTRQSLESVAKAFQGPKGRSGSIESRPMPVEVDHLYIFDKGDPLVYEGGFAYPIDFYRRAQTISTGQGVTSLASDPADIPRLTNAFNEQKIYDEFDLSIPHGDDNSSFRILKLKCNHDEKKCEIVSATEAKRPSGVWFRSYPPGGVVEDPWTKEKRSLTPRIALDDRGRVFARANLPEEIAQLMTDMLQGNIHNTPRPTPQPGDQRFKIGVSIKLPKVYRGVLKTGINLLACRFGSETTLSPELDKVREAIISDDKESDELIMKRCRFGVRSEFVKQARFDQHRLELRTQGRDLVFEMILYGSNVYSGNLGIAPSCFSKSKTLCRVIVDYTGRGMRYA